MTVEEGRQVIAAIDAARAAGRNVEGVEFPRSRALARGPWSIGGVPVVFHSWYVDHFNLKLTGVGGFRFDDELVTLRP